MKKKILVVDDAPFIREIVKQILIGNEKFDFLGEATNGLEAITQAEKLQPDIILMDIVMPEMSGIKATQEILKKHPNIKIVSFTTMDNPMILNQAIAAGCIKHMTKPFTKDEVLSCLDSI